MNTNKRDDIILMVLALVVLLVSFIGSFVVSGNILDLICIIILVTATIHYLIVDHKSKSKKEEKDYIL